MAFLAEAARGGPILELAIGTGRLGLPLAERGLEVHGIDASEAMVAKLRVKPGGDRIPVTMGDFADAAVEGSYRLIFVCFNTFYALLTQEDQVRCFANVAGHLEPDGSFVIEAFVPALARFPTEGSAWRLRSWIRTASSSRSASTTPLSSGRPRCTSSSRRQGFGCTRCRSATRIRPSWTSWPSLAGLRLRSRWGGWRGEPFTGTSERHVSVYEPAPA